MESQIKKTRQGIKKIKTMIYDFSIPLNNKEVWDKNGVTACIKKTKKPKPNHKYVVTPYYKEVSWLLFQLEKVFIGTDQIYKESLCEFSGRLANAANWYIQNFEKQKIDDILFIVIEEAYLILHEIEEGIFMFFPFDSKGFILDDFKPKIAQIGPLKKRKV